MCRRSALRRSQAWALVVLVGLAFVAINARYVLNAAAGPWMATGDDLRKIADPNSAHHYFLTVNGDKVIDTGVQEITTETTNGEQTNQYVSAGYYALAVGDRLLIVKSTSKPPLTVTGAILPIPQNVNSQLFSGLGGPEAAALEKALYPFYLDTGAFRTEGYIGIGIVVVLLFLIYKYARPAWNQFKDPSTHPAIKHASTWGDPVSVSAEVENDFNNRVRFECGDTRLTDKYVIKKSFFHFNVSRLEDLLWAYKKVIKRSVNFIPTGKSYQAVLICYGSSAVLQSSESRVAEILAYAAEKTPWAVFGYTKELSHLFSKETSQFCAAVEARREDYLRKK